MVHAIGIQAEAVWVFFMWFLAVAWFWVFVVLVWYSALLMGRGHLAAFFVSLLALFVGVDVVMGRPSCFWPAVCVGMLAAWLALTVIRRTGIIRIGADPAVPEAVKVERKAALDRMAEVGRKLSKGFRFERPEG